MSKHIEVMRELGVQNPNNPSEKDLKLIIDNYLKAQKIDQDIFTEYMKNVSPSVKELVGAVKSITKENKELSEKAINSLDRVIKMLEKEYESAKTEDQKDKIWKRIETLLQAVREEVRENRNFALKVFGIGAGAVVVLGGVGLFLATRGRNTEVIKQGVKQIKNVL
jgi:hypothetical protein